MAQAETSNSKHNNRFHKLEQVTKTKSSPTVALQGNESRPSFPSCEDPQSLTQGKTEWELPLDFLKTWIVNVQVVANIRMCSKVIGRMFGGHPTFKVLKGWLK